MTFPDFRFSSKDKKYYLSYTENATFLYLFSSSKSQQEDTQIVFSLNQRLSIRPFGRRVMAGYKCKTKHDFKIAIRFWKKDLFVLKMS